MAGIAGWIAPARSAADENALAPMLGALRRRGIGSLVGYVERDRRRQAVLGASLVDDASRIALVLDGGIANGEELRARLLKHSFQFKGDSPEEVLLRAYQYWDKEVVKQLRGAFAFAIWDARKDRLLLARDRFGEKPLYLHEKDGALYFASEVKALLQANIQATVDLCALHECLTHRYVPGPRTLFAGIRKLAPGSYGAWQYGKLHEVRYWTPPDGAPYARKKTPQPVEGFLARMQEAVALHQAEGLLLSGGVDSAVLLALASARGAPPKTFSLGFAGDKASELPAAAHAANYFGSEHHELVVTPQELMCHLEYLVACRDAPVPRPSELALCRLAAEAGRRAKTVLSGDGCDEVLGGYRRYVAEMQLGGVESFPARLLAPLAHGGRFDSAAAPLRVDGWPDALLGKNAPDPGKEKPSGPKNSALRRMLYADQSAWLPDQLLECVDRAGAGLELRLPYLDHRVAEYVSALPDGARVSGFTTKRILREVARRVLPAPLAQRAKGGLRLDVGGWLRNELRDFTLDHLQAPSSVTRQYYDAAALDTVLAEHLKGRKNHETLVWTLLNIEIWHRAYRPA